MELFLGAGIAGVAAALTAASTRLRRKPAERWAALATFLELELTINAVGNPTLQGSRDGIAIEIRARGLGAARPIGYRATFPAGRPAITLERQRGVARLLLMFEAPDAVIGKPDFDNAFIIKEGSTDRARRYLTLERRNVISRLYADFADAKLTTDDLSFSAAARIDDVEMIKSMAARLISAARLLAGLDSVQPSDVTMAMQARLEGDLALAGDYLHDSPRDKWNVDKALLSAEVFIELGRTEEAEDALEELERMIPTDESVQALRAVIDAPPDAAPQPANDPLDMEVALDRLFTTGMIPAKTLKVFEGEYRDQIVDWTGVVLSAEPIDTDLTFALGNGLKVIVGLASIEEDLYGIPDIRAVVWFPDPGDLSFEPQDRIRFLGRLARIDAGVRMLYISHGKLVE